MIFLQIQLRDIDPFFFKISPIGITSIKLSLKLFDEHHFTISIISSSLTSFNKTVLIFIFIPKSLAFFIPSKHFQNSTVSN